MAKKTKIEVDLFSPASIDNAIAQLNLYNRQFDAKVAEFTRKLALKGVEIAKEKIKTVDAVFTGELLSNIRAEERKGCYLIISDTDHTAFVEFGTGQLGMVKPYKYPFPQGVSWKYATGEHIQISNEPLQWGDYTIPANTYFWFYYGNDGRWHLTQGMPSRPFMYETALTLAKAKTIREVAKEVFG